MAVVTIAPTGRWLNTGLREVWQYRELLVFFIWRDVKVRYKQTLFGAAWAVLQPALLMVVFTVFLGRFIGNEIAGIPYPVWSYVGLVPWTFFAQSVNASTTSLVTSANLVSKIYFPRVLLPMGATGSFLIDIGIAFAVLILLMLYYGLQPSISIVLVPIFILLAILTSLAIGIWTAALNARYRDVQYAIPFLIQVWLFASPVGYPRSIAGHADFLYGMNPMAGVVEGFRWAVLDTGAAPTALIVTSSLITFTILVGGLIYFHRAQQTFADVI